MRYTLMNKTRELLDVEMDRGTILSLHNIRDENKHLLPVFLTPGENQKISRSSVADWWSGRRIPASRGGIKELFWHLNDISLDFLAEKSLGLSLSDQYWIRPNKETTWESVNFFQNDFSEDIGKLLTTGDWNGGSLISPDNTSDGVVRKRWKIIDKTRYLIKGSSGIPWQAQPFREVFASRTAKILFEAHGLYDKVVEYDFLWDGDFVYSKCPNFVTVDTEYVAMYQINQAHKKSKYTSAYEFTKGFFGNEGEVLDLTLILDYIVLNEDRHFGNFGLIRNADTGEYQGAAPLFDTGASLFFDSPRIDVYRIGSKPFSKSFSQQIKYIDTSAYAAAIKAVDGEIETIFWDVFKDAFEEKRRLEQIMATVKNQLKNLNA